MESITKTNIRMIVKLKLNKNNTKRSKKPKIKSVFKMNHREKMMQVDM